MTIEFTDFGLSLAMGETQPNLGLIEGENLPARRRFFRYFDSRRGHRILLTGTNSEGEEYRRTVNSVVAAFAWAESSTNTITHAWLLPTTPPGGWFGATYQRRLVFRVYQ